MNCQEVELIITDLARHGELELDARNRALAHLDRCRDCSGRLQEEQRLTAGLRAWNSACVDEQPRPALEGILRAAYRRKVPVAPRRRWPAFALAGSIAAAVLLFRLLTVPAQPPAIVAAPAPPQPQVAIAAARVPDGIAAAASKPVKRRMRAKRVAPVAPAEVGTEFMSVAQGDGWTPLDGGRLVRVRLPHSAMGVFGLPFDPGRAPERVQADVVLSDDGLLRAIRFVR